MLFFWIFLAFEIGTFLLCFLAIRRLYKYIRRYRFDESMYTLLFGFIHLHYLVWLYIGASFFMTVAGLLFAYNLFIHALPA